MDIIKILSNFELLVPIVSTAAKKREERGDSSGSTIFGLRTLGRCCVVQTADCRRYRGDNRESWVGWVSTYSICNIRNCAPNSWISSWRRCKPNQPPMLDAPLQKRMKLDVEEDRAAYRTGITGQNGSATIWQKPLGPWLWKRMEMSGVSYVQNDHIYRDRHVVSSTRNVLLIKTSK